MTIMNTRHVFLAILSACLLLGCGIEPPIQCPNWLENNDEDTDEDKVINCWDICPYNTIVSDEFTRTTWLKAQTDTSNAPWRWGYVCNLNNPFYTSEKYQNHPPFTFQDANTNFHIYRSQDLYSYKKISEEIQNNKVLTAITFHDDDINLVELCESTNEKICTVNTSDGKCTINWDPIVIPNNLEHRRFRIEGKNADGTSAKIYARIQSDDKDIRCVLDKPLFSDLSNVTLSNLEIDLDFEGDLSGGIANTITDSDINSVVYTGKMHLTPSSEKSVGFFMGEGNHVTLNNCIIDQYLVNNSTEKQNSELTIDGNNYLNALGGFAGKLIDSSLSLNQINQLDIHINSAINYSGILVGEMENGHILNTEVTNSTLQIEQNGSALGGFVGFLKGSGLQINHQMSDVNNDTGRISSSQISHTTIKISSDNMDVGGLIGKTQGGHIIGVEMNDLSLDVDTNIGNTGGMIGSLINGEMTGTIQNAMQIRVTNKTDNSDKELILKNETKDVNSESYPSGFEHVESAGGIVGHAENSQLLGCKFNASKDQGITASGKHNVGGLVGFSLNSQFMANEFNHNDGTVKGKSFVGGGIGRAVNTIMTNNIIHTKQVMGESYIGGVIGKLITLGRKMEGQEQTNQRQISYVRDTKHKTETVSGNKNVGGFVGGIYQSYAFTELSMNLNQVESIEQTDPLEETGGTGGFVGEVQYSCDNAFDLANTYNGIKTIKGVNNVGGIVGKIFRNEDEQCEVNIALAMESLMGLLNENAGTYASMIAPISNKLSDIFSALINSMVNNSTGDILNYEGIYQIIDKISGTNNVATMFGSVEDNSPKGTYVHVNGFEIKSSETNPVDQNWIMPTIIQGNSNTSGAIGTILMGNTNNNNDNQDKKKTIKIESANMALKIDNTTKDNISSLFSQIQGMFALDLQCINSYLLPKDIEAEYNNSTMDYRTPYFPDSLLGIDDNQQITNYSSSVGIDEDNIENSDKFIIHQIETKWGLDALFTFTQYDDFVALLQLLKDLQNTEIKGGMIAQSLLLVKKMILNPDIIDVDEIDDSNDKISCSDIVAEELNLDCDEIKESMDELHKIRNDSFTIINNQNNNSIDLHINYVIYGKNNFVLYYLPGMLKCMDIDDEFEKNSCILTAKIPDAMFNTSTTNVYLIINELKNLLKKIYILYADITSIFDGGVCNYVTVENMLNTWSDFMKNQGQEAHTNISHQLIRFSFNYPKPEDDSEPQDNPESDPQDNPEPDPQDNPEPDPQDNPEPDPQDNPDQNS